MHWRHKMRIYWDVTKVSKNRVFSGLNRVSQRLRQALSEAGEEVIPVAWSLRNSTYLCFPSREPIHPTTRDVFVTPELFSEHERPGANAWVQRFKGRCFAVFHDAIPLKFPEFTWPKSVARHPFYLKDLAAYDGVLANSQHSCEELLAYWDWLGIQANATVSTIPLGADFSRDPRVLTSHPNSPILQLLMVGILEPRKNHDVVLSAMEILRTQGKAVQLSIVGRVNPHFGKPVLRRIETLIRRGLPIRFHRQVEDSELVRLYEQADLTLFPSRVEGNGLPVIESLWRGIPTIASSIPPHLEHASRGGGIRIVNPMDASHLAATLDQFIDQPETLADLKTQALQHDLPTWKDSARVTLDALRNRAQPRRTSSQT
ncbi:MAG: glycosyltransferase [Puniceicoccaceae bacterium]